MPRQAGVSVENQFTKGLITETTGINSPENSVVESDNFIYDRRGRATRRLGVDYEAGFASTNLNASTTNVGVIAEYLWETVSNIAAIEFVVVQVANKLLFFTNDGTNISPNKKTFEVDLLTFKVPGWTDAQVYTTQASFATGNGKLFVAHSFCNPFLITYDLDTDSITTTLIDIKTRDFEGVVDNLAVETRPTNLTTLHKYNLWNQGWWDKCKIFGGSAVQTLAAWRTVSNPTVNRNDWPSNADVWWYYKITYTPGGDNAAQPDVFRNNQPDAIAVGNTPAPKGHFIYSAWQTARSATVDKSGAALGGTVPETSSNGARPSVVAFYYGRVFYAGVRNNLQASSIYFTQIVERDEQYGYCYQQSDPTSEKNFDLLPSDGGVIKIPDIVNIIEMKVFGPSLYIFAANGVWTVTGSNNSSFKATDYQVKKIGDFPALGKNSIIDVGGAPIWWNNDAIYTIEQSGSVYDAQMNNISLQTIQTFFNQIPDEAKLNAKGSFNQLDGLLYWVYRQAPAVSPGDEFRYDHVLVLDVVTKAFYPFSVPVSPCAISGIVAVRNADNKKIFKILTTGTIAGNSRGLTFSEFNQEDRADWVTESGGIEFLSYFISGYRVRGELLKKFQSNYIAVITDSDPLSSGFIQGVWDYTTNPDSGRFTNPQQVYRPRYYYAGYQRARIKMRGNGYSLQFKFYSDGRKPFSVVGWAVFETANAQP